MFWSDNSDDRKRAQKERARAKDIATKQRQRALEDRLLKESRRKQLNAEYEAFAESMGVGNSESGGETSSVSINRGFGNSANRDRMHQGGGPASPVSLNRGLGNSGNRDLANQGSSGSCPPGLNRGLGSSGNRDLMNQSSQGSCPPMLNRGFGDSGNRNRFGQATKIFADSTDNNSGTSEKGGTDSNFPKLSRGI